MHPQPKAHCQMVPMPPVILSYSPYHLGPSFIYLKKTSTVVFDSDGGGAFLF